MNFTFVSVLAAASLISCKAYSAAPAPAAGAAPSAKLAAPSKPAPDATAGCLTGSWVSKVGDKNVYTFNADKTGERIHLDAAHSTFTWSMKDEKTALVVFPEHGDSKRAEFEFTVDCAAKVIKFQDMVPFAKQ